VFSRGGGHQAGVQELPRPVSRRDASHRDGVGQHGVQLDGMGQGTKVVGRRGMVPCPSLGLQREGDLHAGELVPITADDRLDTVVAVGQPGRQLHLGQLDVAFGQGVGALQREGTRRQDVSRSPRPHADGHGGTRPRWQHRPGRGSGVPLGRGSGRGCRR